jgi:hypothetical protein
LNPDRSAYHLMYLGVHRYLDFKTDGDNGDTGTRRPLVPDWVRMGSRRRFPAGDTAGDRSQCIGDRTRGRAGNTGSGSGSVVTSGCPTGPGWQFLPEIPCRGMVRRACSCASVPTPRSTGNGCRSCRRGLPGQHEPGRPRLVDRLRMKLCFSFPIQSVSWCTVASCPR